MSVEIAGICFTEAYEAIVYKQIVEEGYSNLVQLLNPFDCIKPIMIPDSTKILTMTGDCLSIKEKAERKLKEDQLTWVERNARRSLRAMRKKMGYKEDNCEKKYKTNVPITQAVTDAVQEQIKREFKSGKWSTRGSNLTVARENIVDGVFFANPDLDVRKKDAVRNEVERQLLQQQFMGDVMKYNNTGMGTSSAQGFAPQFGNKLFGEKKV